uniref:Uncharacterized protein n=1 Tax=Anguilla anguilla TaxID=7936 RepID=A0A0E9SQK7_ANGAN
MDQLHTVGTNSSSEFCFEYTGTFTQVR